MLEALIKRYEAQIAEAQATIDIYLNNSVGIGEHPQHIEELDKLFGKIAEAEDKLKIVERWED
jgi:ABC-type enterochelin transport system substrate-binding protein